MVVFKHPQCESNYFYSASDLPPNDLFGIVTGWTDQNNKVHGKCKKSLLKFQSLAIVKWDGLEKFDLKNEQACRIGFASQ